MLKMINVKKVIMEGFKVNRDRKEVKITNSSIFVGNNGKGKSTIADAIAWCLTGKLYEGNRNVNGEFLNEDSNKAIVKVIFVDESGVERVVKRNYTEASGVNLWIDGKKASQKKLNKLIDADTFLLAFNPLNFLGKRTTEARNALMNLIDTSSVDEKTVLDNLSPYDKVNLQGIDLTQTEKELKELRKKKTEQETKKTITEGYIAKDNEIIEKMVIPQKKNPVNQNLIANLENKITGMVNNKPILFKGYTDLLNKKNEFEKKISEIKTSKFDNSEVLRLEKEKALLEVEFTNTQKAIFTPENLIKFEMEVKYLEEDSQRLSKDNEILRKKIIEIRSNYAFKVGDTCPMCQQVIDAPAIKNIKKFITKQTEEYMESGVKNKSSIEDLEKKLKSLTKKITLIKSENKKREKEFNKTKSKKISLIQGKIKTIQIKIETLKKKEEKFEQDKLVQIKPIQDKIKDLNLEKTKKDIDEYESLIKNERITLEKLKKENVNIVNFNKDVDKMVQQKDKLIKEIEDYNKEIEKITGEIKCIVSIINSIANFSQTRIKLIEELIKKHFNKVSFKIEKVIEETAEIKPCFEINYDGKGINTCSLSEQMKAGIEIAEMIKSILDIDYPLFLDNSESILEINTSINQIIRTVVVNVNNIISINSTVLKEMQEATKEVVLKAV